MHKVIGATLIAATALATTAALAENPGERQGQRLAAEWSALKADRAGGVPQVSVDGGSFFDSGLSRPAVTAATDTEPTYDRARDERWRQDNVRGR